MTHSLLLSQHSSKWASGFHSLVHDEWCEYQNTNMRCIKCSNIFFASNNIDTWNAIFGSALSVFELIKCFHDSITVAMDGRDYQDFNSEEEGHGWYNQSANTGTNNSTKIEVPLRTVHSKETPSWWKVQLNCLIALRKRTNLYHLPGVGVSNTKRLLAKIF